MLRDDDFDHPFPKRETNWTLSKDERSRTRASLPPPRPVNQVDDIDGAQAGTTALFRSKKFEGKPNLFSNSDIEGSSPTRSIPTQVNKDNTRNLRNSDIEHSYPESKLFSTPRVVNPLDPVYPLPAVRHRIPTPVQQRHETMKISDIPGTRAKPARITIQSERNILDYSDVSLPGPRKRTTTSQSLETHDINHAPTEHRGITRTDPINPLDPVYKVSGSSSWLTGGSTAAVSIGQVEGSKPKGLPPARQSAPMFSLTSKDIDGASPGNSIPYPKVRRGWHTTNDTSDIVRR